MAFGEVFVGALLQVLLQLLASGAIDQILKYVKGNKIDPKTIKNFEKSLQRIAALLNDAQQRRIESESFKLWVKDLQDLAYDLEDFLNDLATDAQLQLQHQPEDDEDGSTARNITCLQSAKTKVKDIIACGSRAMQHIHYSGGELPSKIEELNGRLQEILNQARDNVGLVADISKLQAVNQGSTKQNYSWRETTSLVSEPIVYGRENIKHDVIQKLLKEDLSHDNYVVFSFVGMGGIGKTTLAQCVYNDQKLKDHFRFKAWVCVSDVFDVTRVTTEIINSSSKNANHSFSSLNQAQNALIQEIQHKRFLIVLDDVWTENYNVWTKLITPFQHGERGSRVIVTTRIENVARMAMGRKNPTDPINVEGLSDDDCWRLFKQHVHEGIDDLDEMRDDIVNKCKGLPLAAKALGGLFVSTTEKRQRLNILKSHIWTEKGDVLPILKLSYYHLPSNLKPIFAYCCVLPKDYKFKEMEMILLWMAQGLLIEEKKERIEDTGHLCFQGLVSRSLFERSPSNNKCYVMHDLVHDLAQWAAGDICCCVMDMKGTQREVERIRHLYITSSGIDHALSITQPVAAKLRTLICPAKKRIDGLTVEFSHFIMRYQCVRTLILASGSVDRLPKCVGDLKHLRFLELKFPKIRVFPDSIWKLCNLEVLFLEGCFELRKVTNVKYLVQVRHLRFHQSLWESMPLGIGKLTNLQSLGRFYLGVDRDNNESMIKELGSLRHLHGKLCVEGLEKVRKVEDAREAKLHEKLGLTKMSLSWDGERDVVDDNNDRGVLEQLKPHSGIEECQIIGYMGLRFPSWLGDRSFENMASIKLAKCRNCECLPPLGQLPSLKKLEVARMDEITWVGNRVLGGPCLEELDFVLCDSLISITEIPVELTKLNIIYCTKLQKMEFRKDLQSLATTDSPNKLCIDLRYIDSLVTVGQIPLTVQGIYLYICKNLKYLLFDEKAMESKEEEEESAETIQESSNGGDNSLEVPEKQVQNDPLIVLSHLLSVNISYCKNFISLPTNLFLPSVQSIVMQHNEKQEAIPEQIHTFTTLEELVVKDCPNIHCFPKGGLPKNCRDFRVHCVNIEEPPIGKWGLHLLSHLQKLTIEKIGSTTDTVECIPGPDLHLPSSLTDLSIMGFKNLKSFNCSSFPNLTHFYISNCPELENLGDYNCLPPNLTYLRIFDCPRIEQQCEQDPHGIIALNYNGNRYILTNPLIRSTHAQWRIHCRSHRVT